MITDTVADLGDKIVFHDWDGHAEDFKLPENDVVGILGFSSTQSGRFHDFTFAVAVSTFNDTGVYRLTSLIDRFYRRLEAEKQFDVYDPETGTAVGKAVIFDGTSASPMARVDARPTQTVMCSGRLTLTVS